MEQYRYTYTWFLGSEIKQHLLRFVLPSQKHSVLEIGCFEGLSSVYFADNLLAHPDSQLICVDPFLTIQDNDHSTYLKGNQEDNFDYNISTCKNSSKISVKKITSDDFFKTNTQMFDLIYIDGCHEPDFITRDMENSWRFLEKNGIMWMDDYSGGDGIQIKNTMNQFLDRHIGEYTIIHKGYQLALQKL